MKLFFVPFVEFLLFATFVSIFKYGLQKVSDWIFIAMDKERPKTHTLALYISFHSQSLAKITLEVENILLNSV